LTEAATKVQVLG